MSTKELRSVMSTARARSQKTDLRAQDNVLTEIVGRLVEAFQPERIYLFGSKARGDAGPDSDYDLMVVVEDSDEPDYRLAQRAHSVLWGLRTAADVLVWPKERFDRRLHLKASLPATILREGKLLYSRMIRGA